MCIRDRDDIALSPKKTYTNMKNIWLVPTLSCLLNWLERTKFKDVEVISTEYGSTEEQRATKWCHEGAKSLKDFLDPNNSNLTIEGYPAPKRFAVVAKK